MVIAKMVMVSGLMTIVFIKGNLKMVNLMDTGYIFMNVEINYMKEIGKMDIIMTMVYYIMTMEI